MSRLFEPGQKRNSRVKSHTVPNRAVAVQINFSMSRQSIQANGNQTAPFGQLIQQVLRHFFDSALGGSLHAQQHAGLTDLGRGVVAELDRREGTSGLEEKASRSE